MTYSNLNKSKSVSIYSWQHDIVWVCKFADCDLTFESKHALYKHYNTEHEGLSAITKYQRKNAEF